MVAHYNYIVVSLIMYKCIILCYNIDIVYVTLNVYGIMLHYIYIVLCYIIYGCILLCYIM